MDQTSERSSETWQSVVGFEGWYEVSNLGRIRSLHTGKRNLYGRVLRPTVGEDGYHRVSLCKNGLKKTEYVHIVVALAFLGPRPDNLEVGHKNGRKGNNAADNLAYITSSQNKIETFRHGKKPLGSAHHAAVLNEVTVRRMKVRLKTAKPRHVSREFGVNISTLYSIIREKSWRHVRV